MTPVKDSESYARQTEVNVDDQIEWQNAEGSVLSLKTVCHQNLIPRMAAMAALELGQRQSIPLTWSQEGRLLARSAQVQPVLRQIMRFDVFIFDQPWQTLTMCFENSA